MFKLKPGTSRLKPAFSFLSPFVDFSFLVGPNIDFLLFCEWLVELPNLAVSTNETSASTHKRPMTQEWQILYLLPLYISH